MFIIMSEVKKLLGYSLGDESVVYPELGYAETAVSNPASETRCLTIGVDLTIQRALGFRVFERMERHMKNSPPIGIRNLTDTDLTFATC